MAAIYEFQGHKKEAIAIYEELIKKDPTNQEAREALARLKHRRKKAVGVNLIKKEEFILLQTPEEYRKFEEWLAWA